MLKIILKNGKERSLLNFHPWLFSGAIAKIIGTAEEGAIAQVFDAQQQPLAIGHFYPKGSIAVRIFHFGSDVPRLDTDFWAQKIRQAFELRRTLGLADSSHTTAYRLVHAEGDNLPGLIVDIYGDTAVLQIQTSGMERIKNEIAAALVLVLDTRLQRIYDKENGIYLWQRDPADTHDEGIVTEYNLRFYAHWKEGQKTGFFLDQRDNRRLLQSYCAGKTVLNAFSYSGGFSVYALAAGAARVDSVDVSQKAITWANQNVALNGGSERHRGIAADCFEYLRQIHDEYEVIVLDPPAFAKHKSAESKAAQGYKQINLQAFRHIRAGGFLFTFSCSQVITRDLFRKIVFAAAADSKRKVRIVQQLGQSNDHPINIYHPEGDYLKGLALQVE